MKTNDVPVLTPERFAAVRAALRVSQLTMAQHLHTDKRTIQRWEAGEIIMSERDQRICALLVTSPTVREAFGFPRRLLTKRWDR